MFRLVGICRIAFLFCTLLSYMHATAGWAEPQHHLPGNFVEVNGAKLWYESEGNGPPLILIAGGPGFPHDSFEPWFSSLAHSHRVIYFDAFGRGKSDRAKNRSEYSFDRDVRDVEGLRQALHLGKIDVLGHSYGGMVAQGYALRYPDAVSHLILVDTFYSGEMWQANNENSNLNFRNQYPEAWSKVEEVRAAGHNSCSKEYNEVASIPSFPLLYFYNGDNAQRFESSPPNPDVYCAIAGDDPDFLIGGDIAKLDFRTQLSTLHMPILVLASRYDRVSIPYWAAQYQRYAPGARLVWFEKSGHFPFIEETQKTMLTIEDFLK